MHDEPCRHLRPALLLFIASIAGAWQQDVRYDIRVSLDTKSNALAACETIWYRNNSPDTLTYIWLHLYPNAYRDRNTTFARELERENNFEFSFAPEKDRGGLKITGMTLPPEKGNYRLPDLGSAGPGQGRHRPDEETEMRLPLPKTLEPGDSVVLGIDFEVKIPAIFSRMGHAGRQYVISQWYPKVAVYDPVKDSGPGSGDSNSSRQHGQWHPDDYHAIGEFYGDFGGFDVRITLPADMAVGATGKLVSVARSLESAESSSAPVETQVDSEFAWMKRPPAIRNRQSAILALKTLHFHAEHVHDFCWVADPDFVLVQDTFRGWGRADSDSGFQPPVLVNVLIRRGDEKAWKDVPGFACRALELFSRRYGPYACDELTVVDVKRQAGSGMEYPTLVAISSRMPSFTRFLEETVVHEIGHQWFYGMLGSNEMAEAWLDEGITTFAVTRYFEETYGRQGNLTHWPRLLRFLPGLDERYYQKMMYQFTATNGLLKPILTPAWEFNETASAYTGVEYAEAGLVVSMLRSLVGDSVFDRMMSVYCARFRFRHPRTRDFVRVAEEVSGRDLHWFFKQWLTERGTCDYAIGRVRRRGDSLDVEIRRNVDFRMPVEIGVLSADGHRRTFSCTADSARTSVTLLPEGRVKSIVLDPDSKLLETDRWNNYWPRKVEVKPVIDLPSFDSYGLFYGPYAWWDNFHGFQLGPWLMGRQFIDAGPLHGRHMFTLSEVYSTYLQDWETGGSYSTPLAFISERLKLGFGGSYSKKVQTRANAELSYHLGSVFGPPTADFSLWYRFQDLRDMDWLYRKDWDSGKVAKLEGTAQHNYVTRSWKGSEMLKVVLGGRSLGGDSAFSRVSIDVRQSWRPSRDWRVNFRLFAGVAGGSPPVQEQFYLSGSLTPTEDEPITWSYQSDIAGTQGRWHIDGDANMRGFATEHQKGRLAGAINVSIPTPLPYVTPFFDIGNVGASLAEFAPAKLKMDAGIRLSLGPLYADFPVWRHQPVEPGRPFDFRWMVGFKLSGLGIGGL